MTKQLMMLRGIAVERDHFATSEVCCGGASAASLPDCNVPVVFETSHVLQRRRCCEFPRLHDGDARNCNIDGTLGIATSLMILKRS